MKRKSASKSAFFTARALIGFALCCLGAALVVFAVIPSHKPVASADRVPRDMPTIDEDAGDEAVNLGRLEQYWNDRLTYPTGNFNPAWVRQAALQHARMPSGIPAGIRPKSTAKLNAKVNGKGGSPQSLSTTSFTALGPSPERMTGCSGCFDYSKTEGRVNAVVVDPTTTTNGSIVAYAGTVGGGVWKTTNCCSSSTTWSVTTDDPLIATTAIDTLTIDPNNHNTIYAGTGDQNYGSFSMGSQGILKSTNGGATWTVMGANVFGPAYTQPPLNFPQYNAVGKVRVDPNNSNNVLAGTKQGLYVSNDAGGTWTQCPMNAFPTQRQDVSGLEMSNVGGTTQIIAAIGVRGFATTVQFDLGNNGANGIYSATMPASGCPTFNSIARNDNGFVFGTAVTGSPYTTGANMNAGSGTIYSSATVGDQLGRIDIAVAPSDPNTIYAQVQSIAPNSNTGTNTGCASAAGCQLGAWVTTNAGTSWTFMVGSAGGSLKSCGSTGTANSTNAGDYPQNWYDQGPAVDPNDSTRVFFDTLSVYFATQGGTTWYDTSCAYTQTALGMHADQHVLTFVPGSSSILIAAGDGGIDAAINANVASLNTARPTWFNMDNGLNTIEFYGGDISGNFANDPNPSAVGGAQDNGPSSVMFTGSPTGPAQWQMGLGGDGFSGQIDPIGTGQTQAQGTMTVSTGGTIAGETFMIGTQTFTWAATRTVAGTVAVSTTTTTAATNIVTAINADIPAVATSVRSGSTVIVTATVPGPAGNAIPFTEAGTNTSMNGGGFLGGTTQGGLPGSLRFWEGNNSGGLSRCVLNCTASGATWTSSKGGWTTSELQSFVLPINMFHGGIPGGDDCATAGPTSGCGHLIAGTTRVWETISGAAAAVPSSAWYVTDNPAGSIAGPNLCKGTLGNRSFINQVKYSPKYQSVAIVGTNDGNVQIGFNLGTGTASQANWVDVTGANAVLPNRPVLGIALDPSVGSASTPVGYAAVGGFNANTPSTLGHVFQVTCAATCAPFNWLDKTGNLPDIPVDSVIVNPNYPQQVFAGTDWGVYFTNDITVASPIWSRFEGSGVPHTMVWDMQVDRGATTLSLWTRGRGAYVYPLTSSNIAPAPVLQSAVSRMTHGGGAGTFDVNLPLAGSPGIEPRSDGTGNYTIVLTFDQPVNSGSASVASGTGNVNTVSFSGNTMTIALSGVANQQTLAVSTNSVGGTNTLTTSPSLNVGFLIGDTTGDGVVNSADITQVRGQSGLVADGTNFREDLTVDGVINSGDITLVRRQSGTALP
jgi:hypothetical protein